MDLNKLSIEELVELNEKIVAEVKFRKAKRDLEASRKIRIGDVVSFMTSKRGKIMITVDGVTNKNVTGKTKLGIGWRVAAGAVQLEPAQA